MRIAVDVMASDHGPAVVTRGALEALSDFSDDVQLIFVGDPTAIRAAASEAGADESRYEIVETSEVIGMSEHPVEAIKAKPESSIVRAIGLVKEGKAEAVISAGSTGAQVAASTLMLRLLPGVRRAGILATMPSIKGHFSIIDVGANVNSKALHLYQYAVMASLFSRAVMGVTEPRVGLLSIGEERSKGSSLIKETYDALEASSLNFIGNCEGHELFHGEIDVVVCDGFVGNVVLKVTEGIADIFFASLKDAATKTGAIKEPSFQQTVGSLKKHFDWTEIGGAQLLGINGVSVITHGRSNEVAIANAVRTAHRTVEAKLNAKIVSMLESSPIKLSE